MDYLKTIEYRIKPIQAFGIIRNCSGCGRKELFISTGQFRINANGNLVDIWLVYQCEKCKHTYNLTVYERVKPKKIPKDLYSAFLRNDEELAFKYGTDLDLLKRNKVNVDISGLEYRCEKIKGCDAASDNPDFDLLPAGISDGCTRIIVQNPYRLKIRIDKLLPELTGISRSKMKKRMQEGKICFTGTYLEEITEIILK